VPAGAVPTTAVHFLTNSSRSAFPSGESAMASFRHEVGLSPRSRTSAWNAHSVASSRFAPTDALLQYCALPPARGQKFQWKSMTSWVHTLPVATCHFLTNSSRSAFPCGDSSIAWRPHAASGGGPNRLTVKLQAQSAALCLSAPTEALLQKSAFPSVPCQ